MKFNKLKILSLTLLLSPVIIPFSSYAGQVDSDNDDLTHVIKQETDGKKRDETVINKMKELGLIRDVVKEKFIPLEKLETGIGSNCSRILFLTDEQGNKYVVKEQEKGGDFTQQKKLIKEKTLAAWQKTINDCQLAHPGIKLPILVDYLKTFKIDYGNKEIRYYTVMSKAKGDSLRDIHEMINSGKIDEKEIVDIFSQIGQQMRQLSRAFFEQNHSFLQHGDASENNFLHDRKRKQFYWIDLSRRYQKEYEKNQEDWMKYFEDEMD